MMTYLGAVVFRLERAWWLKYFGLIIGIAGIVLIVAPDSSLPSRDLVVWILIALVVPLGYATTTIAAALMRPPAMDSLSFSAGYFLDEPERNQDSLSYTYHLDTPPNEQTGFGFIQVIPRLHEAYCTKLEQLRNAENTTQAAS